MVPREPSVEQLNAARDWSLRVNGQGVGNAQATGCYQAMLAAAPPSPDRQGEGEAKPQFYSDAEARRQIGNLEAAGKDWMARAEAAESSRDDLLRQLEEAKGEVETARAHHAGCVEGQKRTIAELKKAEARRDALLAALESAIARLRHIHDSADPDGRGEFPTLRATINTEIRALRTAHEAAAQAGEVKS